MKVFGKKFGKFEKNSWNCIFGRRLGCANSPENTSAQLCE